MFQKQLIASLAILFLSLSAFAQPEKTFSEKLEGIQTSGKELTKNASTDNSSVGQGGEMNTSIPIVTVKSRTMSFPLQLNYSSGITADQKSGSVGLGWVMPIGSITRDYGAYEPDYTSTTGEMEMLSTGTGNDGWLNPSGDMIHPETHHEFLGYNTIDLPNVTMPLSDKYHISIPGMGSNSFWNGAGVGASHAWKWSEFQSWKVNSSEKTFVIDQEFSRINEFNRFDCPNCGSKEYFGTTGSYASAIGVYPYVIGGEAHLPSAFPPIPSESTVEYEDFNSFEIVDDNGVTYIFGRPLRGQKFVFSDNPYWSTSSDIPYYTGPSSPSFSPKGNFWKVDYIAEWLLTEIRSADYEDLNGNGIADDEDKGDWIRFEYTKETQTVQTLPIGNGLPLNAGGALSSVVPSHREWASFSQTDQASSLMRERAYLTKVVTPTQYLDFTISQRMDIDHDFYDKPANKKANIFYYEDRECGSSLETGAVTDFDIKFPVETMKYDTIKVYSKLLDRNLYPSENLLTGAIVLNYADQGSTEELAVSNFTIRNNDNTPKLNPGGTHLGTPSNPSFDLDDYDDGSPRGKTTLLGIEIFGGDMNDAEKTNYSFDYAYNPSYDEIHKREIVRAWTHPSVRQSGVASENYKASALMDYSEALLGTDGLPLSTLSHTDIFPNEFLIDFPYEEYAYQYAGLTNEQAKDFAEQGIVPSNTIVKTSESRPLTPIKDVYGYLYSENCETCPTAWSLTKITYPTGGEISFEYETIPYDPSIDENNWSFDETELPILEDYNTLAKNRCIAQHAYNKFALDKGTYTPLSNQKTLTRTFEVSVPTSYGIRLKSTSADDRINVPVVSNYEYGVPHFTAMPSAVVANFYSGFNQFLIRENRRHQWEQDLYVNGMITGWRYDYVEKMNPAGISTIVLDDYKSTFYFEDVSTIQSDQSKIMRHYDVPSGDAVLNGYPEYEVYCTRNYLDSKSGRYVLGGKPSLSEPIVMVLQELYDATESTPYQTEEYAYTHHIVDAVVLPFDYSGPSSGSSYSLELWSNDFELWLPIGPLPPNQTIMGTGGTPSCYSSPNLWWAPLVVEPFGTGYATLNWTTVTGLDNGYAFVYNQNRFVDGQSTIINTAEFYKKWATTKLLLDTKTSTYKGLPSTTEYVYHGTEFYLEQESVQAAYTGDEYITTYEYAHETYPSSIFGTKNILNAPTRVNTYHNDVISAKCVSAQMTTYDLSSYSIPRVENAYTYETNVATDGTFDLTYPYSLTGPNANWRISESDQFDYSRNGQLISSRTNRLYSKSVLGNNLTIAKATIAHPFKDFDGTYSGFEDFTGKHGFLDWTDQDYKNEYWFDETELVLLTTTITANAGGALCPNSYQWGSIPSFTNEISIENMNGIEIGNSIDIIWHYNGVAQPTISTTITDIIAGPITTGVYTSFDNLICFSDPIPLSFDDPHEEPYEIYASAEKVNYSLSSSYSRTGNYSYQLPSVRVEETAYNKSPIRPVKLDAPNPTGSCAQDPDPAVQVLVNDECQWSYEASVWLKEDLDLATSGTTGNPLSKSLDPSGDAIYQDGTVSETNSGQSAKIVCDIYDATHTTILETKTFYVNSVNEDWKQYTVNIASDKGGTKWLDVYVVNERNQETKPPSQYKSVFIDDIVIYPTGSKYSYSVVDKFGNPTYAVNNDDVFVSTVFDEKSRPVAQKNTYSTIVSEQSYFENPNWDNHVNHVTDRKWVDNGVFNETRYYLDGFGKTKQVMLSDLTRNTRIVSESMDFDAKGFPYRSFKPYAISGASFSNNFDESYATDVYNFYGSNGAYTSVDYEPKPEMTVSSVFPPKETSAPVIEASRSDYVSTIPLNTPFLAIPVYPAGELLVQETVDAIGNEVKTYLDNLGRVIMEEHEIGPDHTQNTDGTITMTTGSAVSRTWFEYDAVSRITRVIDPTGKESTYEYNSLGVVVKKTTADAGSSEMRYDKYGQVRFTRDQKDIDANAATTFAADQFSYAKYDEWGRVAEAGQMTVAPTNPTFTIYSYFDDYTAIDNQDFPTISTPLKQVHQSVEYDGSRDQFNSAGLLSETVYNEHVLQGDYTYLPSKTDSKSYSYLADGQLAECSYNYDGLNEHKMTFSYNSMHYPTGKKYVHPSNSFYDFEWNTELDNLGRQTTNSSIQNATTTVTGSYYYDVLGNLLMKGLGATASTTDPHVDYQVYKFDVRDQLVNHMSKNFRFGLEYDDAGTINNQYWSNEYYDPTTTSVNINQYEYFYDKMNRLIGADYKQGTATTGAFDYFSTIYASINNDFNCAINYVIFDDYIGTKLAEITALLPARGASVEGDALNALNTLIAEYKTNAVPYQAMDAAERVTFFNGYLGQLDANEIPLNAYELYEAITLEDDDHRTLISGEEFDQTMFKYTKIILDAAPWTPSVDCSPNLASTVYGFLPTFPTPTIVTNDDKYDAAYWYTENGNLTDLDRNDEGGTKTEQDYVYSVPTSNELSQVAWSDGTPTTSYTYDANGNILTDPKNGGIGGTTITYDNFNELPTAITNAGGTKNYRYDGQGQRLVKDLSGSDQEYYIDGVVVNQNNEVKSYQTPEGYVTNDGTNVNYFYYVTDWLGTTRSVIDANGTVLNAVDHYPFGKRLPGRHEYATGPDGMRYQYTGHEFDGETNYGYHGARYYNRELGRYMNVDRFAEKEFGQSPYVYAGNEVVNAVDVNGDSIWLVYQWQHDGEWKHTQLKYHDGKLYNSSGSEFKEGIGGTWLKNVAGYLDQLKADDPEGNKIVGFLQGDDANHYISNRENYVSGGGNDRFEDNDIEGIAPHSRSLNSDDGDNGGKGGSWIPFDPYRWTMPYSNEMYNKYPSEVDVSKTQGEIRDVRYGGTDVFDRKVHPRVLLGHEMYHSWSRATGNRAVGVKTYPDGKTTNKEEFKAVQFENKLRKATGKPKRTHYGGYPIP